MKKRNRTVATLLLFWFEFLFISLYACSLDISDWNLKQLSGFSFELTKTKKNHLHVNCHFFKPKIGYEHLYRTSECCQKLTLYWKLQNKLSIVIVKIYYKKPSNNSFSKYYRSIFIIVGKCQGAHMGKNLFNETFCIRSIVLLSQLTTEANALNNI